VDYDGVAVHAVGAVKAVDKKVEEVKQQVNELSTQVSKLNLSQESVKIDNLEEKVIEILRESKYPLSANEIRAKCNNKALRAKDINVILYQKLTDRVQRHEGQPPKFSLKQ
jgi:uncharacterized protein YceH (UPF0502 family)